MRIKLPLILSLGFIIQFVEAKAAEFEPLGKAIGSVLGTSKAFKGKDFFFSKSSDGKPSQLAFVQKGIYEPNCTHTWVVGIDAKSKKVTQIRVVEMSCPHAFPAKSQSFLEQYKGKGPADLTKLDGAVQTVAKATGTSQLTTDAVKKSITAAQAIQ